MRRLPALHLTILALAMVMAVVSCGSSGRTLRDPTQSQRDKAPVRRTSSTLFTTTSSMSLSLFSSVLEPGGRLPNEFSCNGAGTSPPLTWTGVPDGTKSLALFVTDTDADGAVHWLVVAIPPSTGAVTKGVAPAGGTQLTNSFGGTGWKAPCSDSTHSYEIELAAFTDPPDVSAMDPKQAVAALQSAASASTVLTTKFGKGSATT